MDTRDRNKCCFAAISAARITINVGLNFSDSSLRPETTNTLAFLKPICEMAPNLHCGSPRAENAKAAVY